MESFTQSEKEGEMKKTEAKRLLELSDKCPECKQGKMEVVHNVWLDESKYYYLKCKECGFEYDN